MSCVKNTLIIQILKDAGDAKNKNMVESSNKKLNKIKKIIKNAPKDEEKKIIDIVEKIFELNSKK